jgi:hypothetical protein
MVAIKKPIFFLSGRKEAGKYFRQIYEGNPLFDGISSAAHNK